MHMFVIFSRAVLILLIVSQLITAQSSKSKPADAATLRTKFIAAFEKDFDLVKDEMKTRTVERGGGTYWLAFVKPKRTGHFYLQYRYPESGHLDIREHEMRSASVRKNAGAVRRPAASMDGSVWATRSLCRCWSTVSRVTNSN